jgi:hypothetical protein
MVIPAARDVEIEMYLVQNLRDVRTWGYQAEIDRRWDGYADQEGKPPVPFGIACDSTGNLYIADDENHRIQKFDRSEKLVTQWGRRGIIDWDRERGTDVDSKTGRFYGPRGIPETTGYRSSTVGGHSSCNGAVPAAGKVRSRIRSGLRSIREGTSTWRIPETT